MSEQLDASRVGWSDIERCAVSGLVRLEREKTSANIIARENDGRRDRTTSMSRYRHACRQAETGRKHTHRRRERERERERRSEI